MKKKQSRIAVVAIFILLSLSFAACQASSENSETDGDSEDDMQGDIDDEPETEETPTIDGDMSEEETEQEAECLSEEARCIEGGNLLEICIDGSWHSVDCWEEAVGICVDGECIPNWKLGNPQFDSCQNDPHATSHSLAEKAAHLDGLMTALHIHPEHMLVSPVLLREDYYSQWADDNGKSPAEMSEADYLAAEKDATYEDVVRWFPGENDGLFSSIYVVSQVFRYAHTRDPQALAALKLSLGGTYRQLRITGTPGIYTRQYMTPGIEGMSCPENPCSYFPDIGRDDVDKDDNRWVRVNNGCLEHYKGPDASYVSDSECSGEWVAEEICGLDEFNGYCFIDNVSQDEYSGHMMAAAMAGALVDDAEIQAIVADIFDQVVRHLIENDLAFIDHDGMYTEHGRFWAYAGDDFPGFNATLILSWVRAAATITGSEEFTRFYSDCLLKENGPLDCIDREMESAQKSYIEHMEQAMILYFGKDGCGANWNNTSMVFLSILPLIWYETDDGRRRRYQAVLEEHIIREGDNARNVIIQKNAMYNFIYAAMADNGKGLDVEAVNDAICQLRQFPISKADFENHSSMEDRPPNPECISRSGDQLADTPQEIWQRCPQTNVWWNNPYRWDNCSYNPLKIHPGSDYLMVYWMGRYFGFIGEND